jgi:SAM-dependent methyltransferase
MKVFFLRYRFIRLFITVFRLFFLVFVLKKVHYIKESNKSSPNTTLRNLKSLLSFNDCYDGSRSQFFLDSINRVKKKLNLDFKKMKILIIGPRNEGEIYNFISNGFLMKNITAIDLISYSSKIKLFDANIFLKKKSNKYDLIYFGFVIGYFTRPNNILELAKKRLKKNGLLAVCCELYKKKNIPNLLYKFKNIHSLIKIFPKKMHNILSTMYFEKLYFLNAKFVKSLIVIKKI